MHCYKVLLLLLCCQSAFGWNLGHHFVRKEVRGIRHPMRHQFLAAIHEGKRLEANATQLSLDEAMALKQRAQQLWAEARALELQLDAAASTKSNRAQEWTQRLFRHANRTPQSMAHQLQTGRWSVDQVVAVVEYLYQERRSFAPPTTCAVEFQIAQPQLTVNETEVERVDQQIALLINAAALLDNREEDLTSANYNSRWTGRAASTLKSRWNELRRTDQIELDKRNAILAGNNNATVQEYMRRTLGIMSPQDNPKQFNLTKVMERVAMVPVWVPTTLLPFMIASRGQVQSEDIRLIKDRVLSGSGFYCTAVESIPSAALFRGNIRLVTDPAEQRNRSAIVYAEIERRMKLEGIAERVQLFLLPDPEWRPGRDERQPAPLPVILAISTLAVPDDRMMPQDLNKTLLKRASIVLTYLATFLYSLTCFSLNPDFFDAIVNKGHIKPLVLCLPIFLSILAVHTVHELAHMWVAKRHRLKIGPPLPLPSLKLGVFGCITPLRSFPANRKALLDFALSGPVAGFVLSLLLMTLGAFQTVRASSDAIASFPFVPVAYLQSSFLSGMILTFLAPKTMMLPSSQPIPISPIFLAGLSCLLSSALNLLPIFRLDGGRACSAAMGTRFASIASMATLLFMLSVVSFSNSSIFFLWAVMVVLFQRRPEIPVRDDITEVDDVRFWGWMGSFAAAVLALVPFPGGAELYQ